MSKTFNHVNYFSRSLRLLGKFALAILLTSSLSQAARAQLLAYEGFDYEVGDIVAVAAGGGGAGWLDLNGDGSDAWAASVGPLAPYDPNRILVSDVPAGWGYTDSQGNSLPTTGRAMEITNWEAVDRWVDLSGVDPSLLANDPNNPLDTVPKLGVDGTSFWVSFLGQGTEVNKEASFATGENHFEVVENGPFGFNRSIKLGRPWRLTTENTVGDDNNSWGVTDTGPSGTDPSAVTGNSYDEKVFFVARIDFHGGNDNTSAADDDAVTIWTNPDLGSTAPLDAAAPIQAFPFYSSNFNAIQLIGNAGTFYDEIRIGLTYADVAPIAAPSGGADFDGDGDVDGADFLKWQTDLGGAAELANWLSEYGTTSGLAAATGVPEPSSLLLLGGSLVGLAMRRRAKREGGW